MWWIFFLSFVNIESYNSSWRGLLITSPILYDFRGFVGSLISFTPLIECVLFFWRLICFLKVCSRKFLVSMFCDDVHQIAYTCNLFTGDGSHNSFYCFGYFIPMIIIHTLILFISVNSRFHVILFVDLYTYDTFLVPILWAKTPMGLLLCGKFTVA